MILNRRDLATLIGKCYVGKERLHLRTFTRDWLSFQCLQLENGRI